MLTLQITQHPLGLIVPQSLYESTGRVRNLNVSGVSLLILDKANCLLPNLMFVLIIGFQADALGILPQDTA